MKKKPMDIFIILFAAGGVFFSAYSVYIKPKEFERVFIQGHNSEWTFQHDTEETVVVNGPLGNTIVRIRDKSAWIEASPCENQTCVASGVIARQGQWAACLPNKVLLIIEGYDEREDGVDVIVR
jgi:hypothetical protein